MFSSFEKVRNGPVDVFIGKNGLTEGAIKHILTLLQQKKILKLKVQPEVAREYTVDKFVFEILDGIKKVLILDVRGHTIIIGKKAIPGLVLPKKYLRANNSESDKLVEEEESDEDDAIVSEKPDMIKSPVTPVVVPQKTYTYSDDDHIDYSDDELLDKLDDEENPLSEEEYNKIIQKSKEKRAKGKKSPAPKKEKLGTPHPSPQDISEVEPVGEPKLEEQKSVEKQVIDESAKLKKKSSKKSSKSKAVTEELVITKPISEPTPDIKPEIEEPSEPKKKSTKKSTKKTSKKSTKALDK